MSLSDALRIGVIFLAFPLTWVTAVALWFLVSRDRRLVVLRAQAVFATAFALLVTVFAVVFVNNDLENPWFDPEQTRILTRGALLIFSVVPTAYWIRLARKSRRERANGESGPPDAQ